MTTERRIFGPPGAGKTTFVRNQVTAWSARYSPEEMILCSFSRAAARELAGRVDLPASNIATIHALAYRALGRPAIAETGELARRWNAQVPPAWQVADGQTDIEAGIQPDRDHGREMAMYNLDRARLRADWWNTQPMAREWQAFKRETNSVDFNDMIELAIEHYPEHPAAPRVLVVDEAQDLTPLQWRLARQWGRGQAVEEFIVAGDDDQTIYSFTGATPDAFLVDLPADRVRVLSQSYRLPRAIYSAAEQWIRQVQQRQPKAYRPRDAEGQVTPLDATWKWADGIVDCAARHVDQGQTVMILASCAYMLTPTISALRDAGIPFHNPYRRANGAWNPLGARGEGRISTAERYLAFLRPTLTGDWWTYQDAHLWAALLPADCFQRGRKQAFVDLATPDTRDQRLPMEVMVDYLREETITRLAQFDPGWLCSTALASYSRPLEYAHSIYTRRGAAALQETPRLVVGTIHSVKGGEGDVVILMPDISLEAYRQAAMAQEHRDAITRLFYVGMTRARESLYICQPAAPVLAARLGELVA